MQKPTNAAANPQSETRNPQLPRPRPPDLYQIVIECRAESQQRELYGRLRREGLKVRLLIL